MTNLSKKVAVASLLSRVAAEYDMLELRSIASKFSEELKKDLTAEGKRVLEGKLASCRNNRVAYGIIEVIDKAI